MEQTSGVEGGKRHRWAGAFRRILIPMMVAVIFVTITAIVRPATHAPHYVAMAAAIALTPDDHAHDASASDAPQIGLAGDSLNHLPATLVGADFNHIDVAGEEPSDVTLTHVFRYQRATWLKGFEPPP